MARYFPVSIGKGPELSTAYDWVFQTWTQLPSLSFIPNKLLDAAFIPCEGPAGPGIIFVTKVGQQKEPRFIASNIFTGRYKLLPPSPRLTPPHKQRPSARSWDPDELFDYHPRVVRDPLTGSYRVIAFRQTDLWLWFAMIYKARTNTWTSKELHVKVKRPWSFACLNNVAYMIIDERGPNCLDLLAVNLEFGASVIVPLQYYSPPDVLLTNDLVTWGGRLFMVLYKPDDLGYVRILKVDVKLRGLLEVSRGPPNAFSVYDFDRHRLASFHGSRILFKEPGRHDYCPIVTYDLSNDQWTCLAYPPNYSDVWIQQHHLEVMYNYKVNGCNCHYLSPESDLDRHWEV